MKIIEPSFEFEKFDGQEMLRKIEAAGRTCYKSEALITDDSAKKFVEMIIKRGHDSVIEHEKISCRVICDRGVTHEIVRHRLASYSQESTRYCNYANDGELVFIKPFFWTNVQTQELCEMYGIWYTAMEQCEDAYLQLIGSRATLQEARSVLPNSLKTEIVITMNLREWRHFFKLRTSQAAHPQMREIAIPMLVFLQGMLPSIFGDIKLEF